MKVKVNNSYERLRSIMLGDIDFSVLDSVEHRREKIEHIFYRTKEQLNDLQKHFEDIGIEVFRPECFDHGKQLITPYWESKGHRIPLTPRDCFLVIDDTIYETASWTPEAAFSTWNYRHVLRQAFNDGANWLPMPMPLHKIDEADELDNDIPNLDPIIDGPCLYLNNDNIFVCDKGAGNQRGVEWFKRQHPDKTFHILDSQHFQGHLDCHFNILREGLIATFHPKEHFPEYFANWDFVEVAPITNEHEFIDSKIQDDDAENTTLAVNSLSIDQNTIMMTDAHKKIQHPFIKALEKNKIDIDFVKFDFSHFYNHGLTCLTLELHRED